MNYGEALELVHKEIIPFIAFKFEKVYPDAFIKCHTKDEEVYKKANGCMYQWYMVAVNSILKVMINIEVTLIPNPFLGTSVMTIAKK